MFKEVTYLAGSPPKGLRTADYDGFPVISLETPTQAPRRSTYSGYESLSIAALVIAFAVAVLVAWIAGAWILIIPVFLIEAGMYYVVLGLLTRTEDQKVRPTLRNAMYFIFWGGTLALIGVEWLAAGTFPGNGVLLFVIFILWIGVFALVLSLPKMRKSYAPPQQ